MRKGFSTDRLLGFSYFQPNWSSISHTSTKSWKYTSSGFSASSKPSKGHNAFKFFFDKTVQVSYKKMKRSSQLYLSCELEYSNIINWTIQMI